MRILAVIPARGASTRLPDKPLADLGGRPIIHWVHAAATSCPEFDRVVVATDDTRIAQAVRDFGGEAVMTRSDHHTGSDRVAEVAAQHPDHDVVVNLQGDQPFASRRMLSELVAPYLAGERPDMATLACPVARPEDVEDPNVVKVVRDLRGDALYFSRSPLPHGATASAVEVLHHMGLYAFTRETLLRFPTMTETPLERAERLEQLRALEHGVRIRVCLTERAVLEINTAEDLQRARALVDEAGGTPRQPA